MFHLVFLNEFVKKIVISPAGINTDARKANARIRRKFETSKLNAYFIYVFITVPGTV